MDIRTSGSSILKSIGGVQRSGRLTTDSTGARVSWSFIENLRVSAVRRARLIPPWAAYSLIGMTRKQLVSIWRNLWFWQRVLIECSVVVLVFLLLELILHGRAGDFGDATIEGVALGLFYAIIDHASLASNRKGADRRG